MTRKPMPVTKIGMMKTLDLTPGVDFVDDIHKDVSPKGI
jgi:hypothetical protein